MNEFMELNTRKKLLFYLLYNSSCLAVGWWPLKKEKIYSNFLIDENVLSRQLFWESSVAHILLKEYNLCRSWELPEEQANEDTYDVQSTGDRIPLNCVNSTVYKFIGKSLNILCTYLLVSSVASRRVIAVVWHRSILLTIKNLTCHFQVRLNSTVAQYNYDQRSKKKRW